MLAGALLVSIVTLIALGDDYVRFGILHCIAVAMLILPLLVRLAPPLLLVLGVAVIAAGIALVHDGPRSDAHRPPGARLPAHRHRGGQLVPAPSVARARRSWDSRPAPCSTRTAAAAGGGAGCPTPSHARALGWPGRHALPIYLVHQIVLIALVAAALALAGAEVSLDKIH